MADFEFGPEETITVGQLKSAHGYPVGEQFHTEAKIITYVLAGLGLRQRAGRDSSGFTVHADFSVRGHFNEAHARRTGERIREFTYVVLYSGQAIVASHAQQIEEDTARLGFPWYVTTGTNQFNGAVTADISSIPPQAS